eukprot:352695-Chlamydomonas_euryale.AAC.8
MVKQQGQLSLPDGCRPHGRKWRGGQAGKQVLKQVSKAGLESSRSGRPLRLSRPCTVGGDSQLSQLPQQQPCQLPQPASTTTQTHDLSAGDSGHHQHVAQTSHQCGTNITPVRHKRPTSEAQTSHQCATNVPPVRHKRHTSVPQTSHQCGMAQKSLMRGRGAVRGRRHAVREEEGSKGAREP